MQIIFDENLVPELKERYIVLELDTVMQPSMSAPLTLYALVNNFDLNTITNMTSLIQQHAALIDLYKNSKWDDAEFNANDLRGSWRGELDEFYDMVIETCQQHKKSNTTWDGIKYTTPMEE